MDALIVIDVQQTPFEMGEQHDAVGTLGRINAVAKRVRQAQGVVVFVLHDGNESDGLKPDTDGWQVHDAVETVAGDIIVRKKLNDAFAGTDLAAKLAEAGVERLLISGWATDFCVDSTVRSAVTRGYPVVVVGDCHTLSNRPHLRASQVIRHHNWVRANLIAPGFPVRVVASASLYGDSGRLTTESG